MCDIILASPTAVFGQPEINLGVIPGGGGTQRLIRAIGKSRTMELTLTGRNFSAVEAESWGVVSRVVGEGEGQVVKDAVHMAEIIAKKVAINPYRERPRKRQPVKGKTRINYAGYLHKSLWNASDCIKGSVEG